MLLFKAVSLLRMLTRKPAIKRGNSPSNIRASRLTSSPSSTRNGYPIKKTKKTVASKPISPKPSKKPRVDTSEILLKVFEVYLSKGTRVMLICLVLGVRVGQLLMVWLDVVLIVGNMNIIAPNPLMHAVNLTNTTDRALFQKSLIKTNTSEVTRPFQVDNEDGFWSDFWKLTITKFQVGVGEFLLKVSSVS